MEQQQLVETVEPALAEVAALEQEVLVQMDQVALSRVAQSLTAAVVEAVHSLTQFL